jgi:hypothetical protein
MRRKLGIAFSAVCVIVCVLLIALWPRSYRWADSVMGLPFIFGSCQGNVLINERVTVTHVEPGTTELTVQHPLGIQSLLIEGMAFRRLGEGLAIPYWFLVIAAAMCAATPLLRWRFSLRTLLIATTLVALLLGAIVYAVN